MRRDVTVICGRRQHSWGRDELKPLSNTTSTWFELGLTLVDSLDTLWLAGLRQEYEEAIQWVKTSFNPGPDQPVNLFETTIRVLGGLLSAFHLGGGDPLVLGKAAELGLRLSPALHSPSGQYPIQAPNPFACFAIPQLPNPCLLFATQSSSWWRPDLFCVPAILILASSRMAQAAFPPLSPNMGDVLTCFYL